MILFLRGSRAHLPEPQMQESGLLESNLGFALGDVVKIWKSIFGCWCCPRPRDYVRTRKSPGNLEVTASICETGSEPKGNPEVLGEPIGSPLDPEIILGTRSFFFKSWDHVWNTEVLLRSWDHDWSPGAEWEPEDSSLDPETRFGTERPYGNPKVREIVIGPRGHVGTRRFLKSQ
ncbi:hypothetical protein F2Q69_00008443 [Brassica cretica]|uniref:Uncharacterized protein n=1 Tax=Brassica cretica TaxID=69181 RepID=A0A8S9P2R0_BRACR|nr:hypothetical protein F2Q69_00008443 [Brassica cretica]